MPIFIIGFLILLLIGGAVFLFSMKKAPKAEKAVKSIINPTVSTDEIVLEKEAIETKIDNKISTLENNAKNIASEQEKISELKTKNKDNENEN